MGSRSSVRIATLMAAAVGMVGCASARTGESSAGATVSTVGAGATSSAPPAATSAMEMATSTTQPATTTTIAGAGPDTCRVVPAPGLSERAVEVDGRAYPTEIYEPVDRLAVPVAAVIDLHGLDSNGPEQAAITRFRELSDREGFVVAEPSGPIGPLGVTGWEVAALDEPDRDDIAAIDQLIEELTNDQCVDPDRIFVAGYSNGGFLAAELGCRTDSRIAAIVAVAGFHTPEPCDRHVPTLVIHGTADPIVPLGPNGTSLIVDDTTPPALVELLASSIEDEVAQSARAAGCDDAPTSMALADDVTAIRYEGCATGADHELILIRGGGHSWPGAALTAEDAAFLGPTTSNLDATEESWTFFTSHATSGT